jgi:uncharacterized membrane protein
LKQLFSKLTSHAFAGLLVILPLAILFIAGVEIYDLLEETAAFAQLELPFPRFINALIYIALLSAALFFLCLLVGLSLRTGPGKRFADFVEKGIADKIPLLGLVRNLTLNIAGSGSGELRAVEVNLHSADTAVLGWLMETLQDGRKVVFVPSAPAVTLGTIHIVPPDRVTLLDSSVASIAHVVSQWGVGAGELFNRGDKKPARKDSGTEP